jgi:DNA-binding protein Fis
MIERALSEAHGNQTSAARILGVSRDTLRYRMAKFKITK